MPQSAGLIKFMTPKLATIFTWVSLVLGLSLIVFSFLVYSTGSHNRRIVFAVGAVMLMVSAIFAGWGWGYSQALLEVAIAEALQEHNNLEAAQDVLQKEQARLAADQAKLETRARLLDEMKRLQMGVNKDNEEPPS